MPFENIEDWIQQQHREKTAMTEYAARLAASPMKILVLDNFLLQERVTDLQTALWTTGKMEARYAVYQKKSSRVSREDWFAAPEQERFYNHLELVGPKPGYELSRSYLTHLCLREILSNRPTLDYFSDLAGERLNRLENLNGKIIHRDHYLRPHSDAKTGRRLCGVLYLSEAWKAEYGGQFQLYLQEEPIDTVDPICNRLLLFSPHSIYKHAVAPLLPPAGDWQRCNYSFWFAD